MKVGELITILDNNGLIAYESNIQDVLNYVSNILKIDEKSTILGGNLTLYKIRHIVNKRTPRSKKQSFVRVEEKEEIIIGNLERALNKYHELKNRCDFYSMSSQYDGVCELFIPKIHDNGEIAYFPYDETTYIERMVF